MNSFIRRSVQWLFISSALLAGLSFVFAGRPARADGCPPNSTEVKRTQANGEVIVSCQCIAGYTKFQGRCEEIGKVNELKNAKAIKDAISEGRKPPFQPVWDHYQNNRDIAKGFAPQENRCAMVLSITLGVEPRANEASLRDLKLRGGVIPELADAEIAKRYYIRAQELANRLQDEWGEPVLLKSSAAEKAITGKRGIVFIEDGWANARGEMTVDHIDVWNGRLIGAHNALEPRFERAVRVWFWELP